MDGARYLEDGRLTIFRRFGIYYCRIRISPVKKYVWRSLKTSNEATAIALGRRLLFQMEQRDEEGLPPKSKNFSKVIDDYIRYRERDHQHGNGVGVFEVARNMGTSVQVIQEYYGKQATSAVFATRLGD